MLVIYSIGSKIIFFYAIIIAITTGFFSPIFTLYSCIAFSHKLKVRKISQKNGREQMKCNEVENVFKADACVELEADVPADPCDQPGNRTGLAC